MKDKDTVELTKIQVDTTLRVLDTKTTGKIPFKQNTIL